MSSAPTCHFEVQVNGVPIDPINPGTDDRQLAGKDLADFKRERVRIDGLLKSHPVSTKVGTASV